MEAKIKPKDLRIGNYITYDPKYNIPTQIEEIYEYGVHTGYKKAISYDNIYPIELSEDWLIRMGFKKYEDNDYYYIVIGGQFGIEVNGYDGVLLGRKKLDVKYVHQMQNLAHSLTGSELTIKDINNIEVKYETVTGE